nr:RecName: Full=Alpha-galactosidase; AltName: Full=Alpha-D-galactoside galactohydrolase; AltName: Full=Melibiase [Capsicum annuum var. annuum]
LGIYSDAGTQTCSK